MSNKLVKEETHTFINMSETAMVTVYTE